MIWSKAVCVTSYGRMFSEFPRREIRGFVLTACKLPSFRALNYSAFPRGNAAFSFEAGRFQCSTLVQHVFFGERCLYTRYCSTHFLTFQFMYGLGFTGSTAIYFRFASLMRKCIVEAMVKKQTIDSPVLLMPRDSFESDPAITSWMEAG